MENQKEVLLSLEEMKASLPNVTEKAKLNNWNITVMSIKRNFESGNNSAWTDRYLEQDQIEELEALGYTVIISEINNCHNIIWE